MSLSGTARLPPLVRLLGGKGLNWSFLWPQSQTHIMRLAIHANAHLASVPPLIYIHLGVESL